MEKLCLGFLLCWMCHPFIMADVKQTSEVKKMTLQKTVEKLKSGRQVTIVAFGDSITEITFHTRGHMNWAGLLSEAIFEKYGNGACIMINSGKCASTYAEGLKRLDNDVLRFKPDLVILAFGMNDAGGGEKYLDTFRNQVRECVSRIRAACGSEILIRTPNPIVTVNGLPMPKEQPIPGKPLETSNRPLKLYSEALVQLAEELNCAVVDHYTLWTSAKFPATLPVANPNVLWLRMSDAIHPGYQGHLVFFRELAPLFEVSKYFPWEEIEN